MQQERRCAARATDLARFMTETFADEEAEQRRLIVAGAARRARRPPRRRRCRRWRRRRRREAASNYAVDNERTSVDPLPPLGDESGRNWKASPTSMAVRWAPDRRTHAPESTRRRTSRRARCRRRSRRSRRADGGDVTDGRAVAARRQIPTIYYVLAVRAVVMIVPIAWLIAH